MNDNKAEVLTQPSERRAQVQQAKAFREEFAKLKKEKHFLKRRMRLVKQGWRNGVVGVEGIND